MTKAVPVNTPVLEGNELKYVEECIRTGWIAEGPFVKRFETEFSTYVGRKHGIAVSNGSGALDIAVRALDIGPGDEVIMPTFTIISPALSIIRAGAMPVLVDSDPVTWNMDVQQIESRITKQTKAILVVHIYGLPVDMDPVLELAEKYKLFIIEDAAEMIGQDYQGKKCGSFGHISTFSFYSNKHITTGEGGMLVCDDELLAKRCQKLRNLAFELGGRRFVHYEAGWNYRMTNLQAAIGVAQLERIEEALVKKRATGSYYHKKLRFMESHGFQLPLVSASYSDNIYWVFGIIAPSEKIMEELTSYLSAQQIATRPFFWCMHEQPLYKEQGLFQNQSFPVAEKLARQGFYIPGGLGLSESDLDYVTLSIRDYINTNG